MRTPQENKSHYDPGRLRIPIAFYKQSVIETEYAGTREVLSQVLQTMAVQEKLSDRSQFAIEAGASVLNQDCWYIIRYRNDFTPLKDMIIESSGVTYIIRGVIPVDVPQKYWRLLCVNADIIITT